MLFPSFPSWLFERALFFCYTPYSLLLTCTRENGATVDYPHESMTSRHLKPVCVSDGATCRLPAILKPVCVSAFLHCIRGEWGGSAYRGGEGGKAPRVNWLIDLNWKDLSSHMFKISLVCIKSILWIQRLQTGQPLIILENLGILTKISSS